MHNLDIRLESELQPRPDQPPLYRMMVTNRSGETLRGFRLGVSGPARINTDAQMDGGRIVRALSTYCEIAPPAGTALPPGGKWTIETADLATPIRHWTDGATAGFLILEDGSAVAARTTPTRLHGSTAERRRGTAAYPVPEQPPVSVAAIPWPETVAVSGRRTAPDGLWPIADTAMGEAAARAFSEMVGRAFPGEGLVRTLDEGGLAVWLVEGPGGKEGYRIAFAPDGPTVTAESATGLLYGLVTLGQMLRGARLAPDRLDFPVSGSIDDKPTMGWRGCHLDVARRFYSRAEIERFLAIMAWNKLNVLHWHLSEDEAWRVEIDAYPQLTEKAAWRGHGESLPPFLGSGPERSGGFYSKADIRAIVALASQFGIDVVPEIDVPGHCYALVDALPQLRDPGENGLYHSIQHFPNNCLNPAVEATYAVLETIFTEMLELFPSRYFHLGADEVPEDAWQSSPMAKTLSERLGTSGAAPLQAHMLQRLQGFLTARGRITGAWEEASHGGGIDRENCYLVGWREMATSQKLAAAGYDVVVAPAQAYYLDMALSEDWHECGAAWAGFSSVEATYRYDPTMSWSAAERQHLLGVQACIWSEPMSDRAVFDRLVFPRLSAIAEAGWSKAKDYDRFAALVGLTPNLYGQYESR